MSARISTLLVCLSICVCTNALSQQLEFKTVELESGTKLDYVLILPDDFDKTKEYPVLLTLPPGQQNKAMVNAGIGLYWKNAGEKGWIVASPAAPEGKSFNNNAGLKTLGQFIDFLDKQLTPEGGKYYLAGISNGGRSAFSIAGKSPARFHGIMGIPGVASSNADTQRLKKIKDLPIALYAGAKDKPWIKGMQSMVDELKSLGASNLVFEIIPDQGHVIQGWQDGTKLLGVLEKWRTEISAAKK